MGTCAVTIKKRHVGSGAGVEVFADVTLSSSYATGGETLTRKSLGLDSVEGVIACSNANGYNVQMIHGASGVDPLVKVYQGDNANAAAAPGVEVPNTTNLSTVTFRVRAFGNYGGA